MEEFSRCGHQHNRSARVSRALRSRVSNTTSQQGFNCLKQRLWLQYHALAAAEGPVIHGAVTVLGELPQVLNARMNQSRLARAANNPVFQRPGEKLWKNGDKIESHERFFNV